MVLPEDWKNFYDSTCQISKRLIKVGFWDKVSEVKLINWLANFKTDEEKFLSALLLHNITYRSSLAMTSTFRIAIDIIIPAFLENKLKYDIGNIEVFLNTLGSTKSRAFPFRFITIEGIDGKTAKSGPALLRELRRSIGIHKDLFIGPTQIAEQKEHVKAIIIVDDIIGSGENFRTFYDKCLSNNKKHVYLFVPLAANTQSVEALRIDFPEIIFEPVELIDEENSFFNNETLPFNLDIEEMKAFYVKLMREKATMKNPYGFKKQSFSHFFSLSSPNASLPVYYHNSDNWEDLFQR